MSMLDVPLFFVRGNHDKVEEHGQAGIRKAPDGGINLHNQVVNFDGFSWQVWKAAFVTGRETFNIRKQRCG